MSKIFWFEWVEDEFLHSSCGTCGRVEEEELNETCGEDGCEGDILPYTRHEGQECAMCDSFGRKPHVFDMWEENVYAFKDPEKSIGSGLICGTCYSEVVV